MQHINYKYSIENLLGKTIPCTCGVKHAICTKEVIIAENALGEIASCCKQCLPGKRVLLVADQVTWRVAGERVAKNLETAEYSVEVLCLQAGRNKQVTADDKNVHLVRNAICPGIDFLIAVGAGSINDLVKLASYQSGRPYIVVPTAPSMNGYTSNIAAIMSKGIKRTMPAHAPVGVVADLQILATAPEDMVQAGLGDMLSKPVANADWKLSHLIKGEYYCGFPLHIVQEAEHTCRTHAMAIGSGERAAIRILTEALIFSGFSMVIAGSSAPASGGEHLISHYWDMTAHRYGREKRLHGAQVGVATLVTSTLYEKIRQLEPENINMTRLRKQYPNWETQSRKLQKIHGSLAKKVVTEARKKYLPLSKIEREWTFILENWQTIWKELTPCLIPSARIKKILVQAGAPTTVRELGISAHELGHAFLHARDIRSRYTILDFAADLGVLESFSQDVLEESGVLD